MINKDLKISSPPQHAIQQNKYQLQLQETIAITKIKNDFKEVGDA